MKLSTVAIPGAGTERRRIGINPLLLLATLAALAPAALRGQSLNDYTEFYRLLRVDALEHLVLCNPATAPASEPFVIGIRRDTLGRPVQLTRFRFGNADTRSDWATMRISYTRYDSLNLIVERRTYFDGTGMAVQADWAFSEEVYRRPEGQLLQRKILDRMGKPANDSSGVHRALYRTVEPGVYAQEWYYSSGKAHFGDNLPLRPFAGIGNTAYFRRFKTDAHGNLVREEISNIDRRPIPFPGGEYVRAYELNECGLPVKVSFLSTDGGNMSDSSGIASITYAYDTSGRMIEWHSFDLKGNPKGRRGDGVAGMRFTYRQFDGVLVKEEKLDERDRVMK
ncbi:MAG TPA: hypothetical protein VHI13_04235 [Candidatus Kapabacteria bacterium]|nr:hypothetical protein [Candidatus Kapabacteria bacterium]